MIFTRHDRDHSLHIYLCVLQIDTLEGTVITVSQYQACQIYKRRSSEDKTRVLVEPLIETHHIHKEKNYTSAPRARAAIRSKLLEINIKASQSQV